MKNRTSIALATILFGASCLMASTVQENVNGNIQNMTEKIQAAEKVKPLKSNITKTKNAESLSASMTKQDVEKMMSAKKNSKEYLEERNKALAGKKALSTPGAEYAEKVIDALTNVGNAIQALKSGDLEKAKTLVEKAYKLVEEVKKSPNAPEAVAVDVGGYIIDYPGDPKDIREKIILAKAFLAQGKLEYARTILNALRSEMVLNLTLYKIDSLEAGLDLARKYLQDKQKAPFAATILQETLASAVKQTVVVPIPLVMAENALKKASEAETKEDAEKLIDLAEMYLEKAVVLGYIDKSSPEYKQLQKEIEEMKKTLLLKEFKEELKEKMEKAVKLFKNIFSKKEEKEKEEANGD